jgi:plastocyanin
MFPLRTMPFPTPPLMMNTPAMGQINSVRMARLNMLAQFYGLSPTQLNSLALNSLTPAQLSNLGQLNTLRMAQLNSLTQSQLNGLTQAQLTALARNQMVTIPSAALQAINPNFRLGPNLTLPQAAFNISVIGQALRTIPRWAFGNSQMAGYASGYGSMMSYPMSGGYGGGGYGGGGYGGGGYGGGGSGGGMMASNYGGQMMSNPYAGMPAMTQSEATTTSYPAVSGSSSIRDARLVMPAATSALVESKPPEHPATTRDVWMYDNFFSPATIWVPAGTTVRWINYGSHTHSVASQQGLWDSGPIKHGAEFSVTFVEPGTYVYVCRYHPTEMVANVIVSKPTSK